MRFALRLIGTIGLVVFAAGFTATFLSPIHYERLGREFIQTQVEAEAREVLGEASALPGVGVARALGEAYGREIDQIRRSLDEGLPERIAAEVARMQDLDCECRELLTGVVRDALESGIARRATAMDRLTAIIRGAYVDVVRELLLDLRIFTGTNAAVLLVLLVVSFVRERAMAHLVLPSVLLLVALLVSSWFYLFEQNWFFTIVSGDYAGLAYTAYLGASFLFLCDIALNKGRVTTVVCNVVLGAVGAAGRLSPC